MVKSAQRAPSHESEVETKSCLKARRKLGALNLKTYTAHWPDRVFFLPGGKCFFVEFKRPESPGRRAGRPRVPQKKAIEKLRQLGFRVFVVRSEEEMELLIDVYQLGED